MGGRAASRARALSCATLVLVLGLESCSAEGPDLPVAAAQQLPKPSAELRHLLLITADTWRADHFLSERAGQRLTPSLDGLTTTGAVFTDNSSVASMTSPGVAGILTGLMPVRSGVLRNEHILPTTVPTLPDTLRAAGFVTAAFVANPVLRPGLGFERGFDHYELVEPSPPEKKARAEAVTSRALAWLEGRDPAGPRVFLWVHYMEPHGPYEPGQAANALFPVEEFGDAELAVRLLELKDPSGRGGIPGYQWNTESFLRETDARSYLGRYAAEVWSFDRSVGVLLAGAEERGWMGSGGETLLVIASDHGEALSNDHGFYFSHAHPPTQDQIQTPLMFVYPGASGEQFAEPVSNLDIAPTTAALLGVEPAALTDGVNLLDRIEPRAVIAQYAQHRMTRLGRFKWSRSAKGAGSRVDLASDPGERETAKFPAKIRTALSDEFDAQVRIQPLGDSASRFELDEAERAELEALGYMESTP